MLSGKPPFYGDDDKEILNSVKQGTYSLTGSEWKNISAEAKDLIKKMLTYDPTARITAEAAMNHAWIKKKVHETNDPKATFNALQNLKNFRVSFIKVICIGGTSNAIGSFDFYCIAVGL